MTKIGTYPSVSPQDLYVSSTTQQADLGAKFVAGDGREYRYAKAGAVALIAGQLQQGPVEVTGNENLTAVAAAVGDLSIASTSTVTVTANQLAGGYAIITVTPGVGYIYQIAGHAAYTSAAPTFTLTDPIQVALTTTSRIDLVANQYNGVIVNPTTATGLPVGVAIVPTAIGSFGWLQTRGPSVVLADGTVVVGTSLVASNGTAGAVEAMTGVQALIGTAITGIATTEYGAVMLSIN